MILIVTFDLASTPDYAALWALLSMGQVYELTESAWLLSTKKSRGEVASALYAHLDRYDSLFIAPLTHTEYLPEPAQHWIAKQRLERNRQSSRAD